MATATVGTSHEWDVLVTRRQGLNRDLPPGKELLVDAFLTALWGSARAVKG
jgi:hypothetical protein